MDFDVTDEQQALRDAVRRWVDRGFGFERRRAMAHAGGASRALWGELAGLGLPALAVPAAHGGLGCGAVEAMVVMEELGRGLVHAPYAAAALMAPSLLQAAPAAVQAAWLPRMADGAALVVPALAERAARYRQDSVATTARADAGGRWRLHGCKMNVPAGDEADAWLVSAHMADVGAHGAGSAASVDGERGIGLFLVERGAPGAGVTPYPTQCGARAADLALADAPATLLAAQALGAIETADGIGLAAACAEAVGLMDRLVALTVDYMNTRRQFGAPIASFQALRHRIADVKMQLELGRSMSWYATLRLGEPPAARRRALSQAKVHLGHSMRFVGQQCIQLHGGIGVTDEYIASHFFKRLTMLELAHGDTLHHLGLLSATMTDAAGAV